jgi:hypothetical protein
MEHAEDLLAVEAQVEAFLMLAVNDRGDQPFAAELIKSAGATAFAGVGGELLGFGHVGWFGFLKVNPCIRRNHWGGNEQGVWKAPTRNVSPGRKGG